MSSRLLGKRQGLKNGHERVLGYLLKGYPRLSETFITNEILLLERLGFPIQIYAIRNPNESKVHANVHRITAKVSYIPDDFWRSLRAVVAANLRLFFNRPGTYWRAFRFAAVHSRLRRSISTIKRFMQAVYLVQRHLRDEPVAHLHAHFAHDPATVAFFVEWLTGIPYSFTAHAKDIYIQEDDFLQKKINRAKFVVTCAGYNRRTLEEISHGRTPIHQIYHGVDLRTFVARSRSSTNGVPTILSVGRLVPKKGFPVLIQALQRLAARGTEFQCLIIGGGPQREELQAMIIGYGLQEQVGLLGTMTHQELLHYYEMTDIMALACQIQDDGDRDGIPNVLVEAMAFGIPVVSTHISGIPELIEDGVTGLLVPPRDPEALAEALECLIRQPAFTAQLARAARAHVMQHFDVRRNTERLGAVFKEALDRSVVQIGRHSSSTSGHADSPTNDQRNTFEAAFDTDNMRRVLAPIVEAAQQEKVHIHHLDVEVLKRRSKRCVIRYQMETGNGANGRPIPMNLIGKAYRADQASKGERAFDNMLALWGRGFDREVSDLVSIPEPLAFVPELYLLVQEEVPGQPISALLKKDPAPRYMRQLSRVLVKLHSCEFMPGDPFRMEDHLMRCHPKHQVLCDACPELAHDIEFIVQSALEIEKRFSLDTFTLIHGDFHMGQVHVEDGQSWLVDFDALSFGDPAADLGNVIVLLKGKSTRLPSVPFLIDTLLDEYFRVMDSSIAKRIPLYVAITYLRRACKQLRYQRPGWESKVEHMIAQGVACIEGMD